MRWPTDYHDVLYAGEYQQCTPSDVVFLHASGVIIDENYQGLVANILKIRNAVFLNLLFNFFEIVLTGGKFCFDY